MHPRWTVAGQAGRPAGAGRWRRLPAGPLGAVAVLLCALVGVAPAGAPAAAAGSGSAGTVVGWGNNGNGQATPPAGLGGVTAIAAGAFHSLALEGYAWTGFFPPVDNPPMVNTVKAGSAVPVKFGLGGDQGLNVFASGSPSSVSSTCNTGAATDPIEQTVTAGTSGLTYDAATGQYTYVWKTDKNWAGICRTLVLKLVGNTTKTANFQFTK